MCIYACICVYMHVYACICVYMRLYAFICVYISVYASICVYMRVNKCVCVWMHVYACVCVYMRVYARIRCICVYMCVFVCICVYMRLYACIFAYMHVYACIQCKCVCMRYMRVYERIRWSVRGGETNPICTERVGLSSRAYICVQAPKGWSLDHSCFGTIHQTANGTAYSAKTQRTRQLAFQRIPKNALSVPPLAIQVWHAMGRWPLACT